MSVNFKPNDDYVLVQQQEEEKTTISGLVLPSNGEKPNIGTIVAKGDNADQVKIGDCVVFGKYKGEEITINDQQYLVMRELEIVGILHT